MSKNPMVTRTITHTEANLLIADKGAGNLFNKSVILPREYDSVKEMVKTAERLYNDDNFKVVDVTDYKVVSNLYGMTEKKFVENAEILKEKTNKE